MGRAEDLFFRLQASGESALDEFIVTRQSEELFLDFKRSSDNGSGARLSVNDRNNLSKAISGFGNSEGGVVVWGVDCSKDDDGADVAKLKMPLVDAQKFISWLEGAVSGCTIPPHSGVRHAAIPIGETKRGFAVTYIPASDRVPHQDINKKFYYIRAGSDFAPAPHAVLAGMFGRRPQPHVLHRFVYPSAKLIGQVIHCEVGILIRNHGVGIAKDIFLSLMIHHMPALNSQLQFVPSALKDWQTIWSFGRHISLISESNFRLPPEAHVQPLVLNFQFCPPFEQGIEIKGVAGATESVPSYIAIQNSKENIAGLYERFMRLGPNDPRSRTFGIDILGLGEKTETDT